MNKGLTFVELLVAVGIIALISAITLANTGVLSANSKTTAAATVIYDVMKKARHDSVAVKKFNGNLFPSYGVEFNTANPTKITVYADCLIDDTPDGLIDNNDEFWNDPLTNTCTGGDVAEIITLPYNTKIKEIRSVSPGFNYPADGFVSPPLNQTETDVYMEFVRPEPTIWITLGANGPLLEAGRIEIDVADDAEKSTKTIFFHSTGQFEIK
jgi:prepilin-type N-terminal cleavage/methylation domain-containing protein